MCSEIISDSIENALAHEGSLGEIARRTGEDVICCFVPTTPNPTSGFILIVPRKDVTVLDMNVDEALKMVISLGVVVPSWHKDKTAELPFELPDESSNESSNNRPDETA